MLRDSNGKVVLNLTQTPDQPLVNAAVYLGAGTYTLTVSMAVPSDQAAPAVNYWLYIGIGSDLQGTYPTNTSSGGTSTSSGGYAYSPTTKPVPTGSAGTF
jgi:hypothetical protein